MGFVPGSPRSTEDAQTPQPTSVAPETAPEGASQLERRGH